MLETAAADPARPAPDRGGTARRSVRSEDADVGLSEYLSALRRWWWLALATFLVVLAVSIGSLYLIDPVYRAEAEVLVRTEDSRQLFPRTSGTTAGVLTRTPQAELQYVQSDAFQDRAREAAGNDVDVDVQNELDSSVLVFRAESGDAPEAQRTAQTWAEAYVTARHEADVAQTARLRDLLNSDREALNARRTEILAPVAELDEAVADETDPVELSRLLNQRLAIQRTLSGELEPLEAQIRQLNAQITGLEVDLRVLQDPLALAYVSAAAEPPEARANGSMRQSVLVGLVGGLVLAAGAVGAAEALRPRRRH